MFLVMNKYSSIKVSHINHKNGHLDSISHEHSVNIVATRHEIVFCCYVKLMFLSLTLFLLLVKNQVIEPELLRYDDLFMFVGPDSVFVYLFVYVCWS